MKIYFVTTLILFSVFYETNAQVKAKVYFHPTKLEEKEVTIDVHDMHQCHVANWMNNKDYLKMPNRGYSQGKYIGEKNFFIEQADSLKGINIYDYWDGSFEFVVRLTGRFYIEKGYPLNYSEKERHKPARVFRYRKFEVIKGAKKEENK